MKSLDIGTRHILNVYMQRMQLLFPDEMMERLKEVAKQEERPVSEVVRRSIEEFFLRCPTKRRVKNSVDQLAIDLGEIRVSAGELREVIYEDNTP